MAAQMHCHLRKCIQGPLEPHMARVEVKAFEAPAEERATMAVCWREDGEAMFHDICWKAVIDSYKMDNPYELGPREKAMVKEAWKTAEYFDSVERIKQESKRVSKMLKNAKYAIAFTGKWLEKCTNMKSFLHGVNSSGLSFIVCLYEVMFLKKAPCLRANRPPGQEGLHSRKSLASRQFTNQASHGLQY